MQPLVNCGDDDGAGGEATRPMIAQGLVNCGDDDDDSDSGHKSKKAKL